MKPENDDVISREMALGAVTGALAGTRYQRYAVSAIKLLPALDTDEILIPAKDDDFGCICNCAVRYSLGRRTYMPSIVVGFIKPLLPKLNNRTLWCFERDLEGAENYGDKDIDEPLWLDFLAAVKAEIAARGAKGGAEDGREADSCTPRWRDGKMV